MSYNKDQILHLSNKIIPKTMLINFNRLKFLKIFKMEWTTLWRNQEYLDYQSKSKTMEEKVLNLKSIRVRSKIIRLLNLNNNHLTIYPRFKMFNALYFHPKSKCTKARKIFLFTTLLKKDHWWLVILMKEFLFKRNKLVPLWLSFKNTKRTYINIQSIIKTTKIMI